MRDILLAWFALISLSSEAFGQPGPPPEAKPNVATTKALTAEDFGRLPFVEQARISPDGNYIAGLFGVKGKQAIGILAIADKTFKPVLVGVIDETQVVWVRWVNNNNIIVGLRALVPINNDRWYVSRVIGINSTSGAITKLMWNQGGQNAADVLWVPSDGSSKILLAAQGSAYVDEQFWPTVYSVDVATGKSSTVVRPVPDVMDWSADATGAVRTGIGYVDQSRTWRLLYREGAKGSFKTVEKASARKDQTLTAPFMFLGDTSRGLIMRDNGKDQKGIYEFDFATMSEVAPVHVPETGDVEGAIISGDSAKLLGLWTSSQEKPVVWLDPELAQIQQDFDKAVPRSRARIESLSLDRSKMLVRVDAPDTPGNMYFYHTKVGALQKLAPINDALGARRLSPVKAIRYKARDGLDIEAILTLPSGREPKNLPIVIMPHGGPWAQDTLSYDYWAQFLANLGYAVLQPNFRGSTGYGTSFTEKGKGQLGLAMQDDLTDGLVWAAAQGIADPKRACIVGASYGGYAAMWGIAKDPDQYRCAISIAGVAKLRREVNDFGDYIHGGLFRDQWREMTPDFAVVSPINATARIKSPLLLIHGKKDVTVDHAQSVKMQSAMTKAGKSVEFLSLPMADHYFTREPDRIALLKAMETFLVKHNSPR